MAGKTAFGVPTCVSLSGFDLCALRVWPGADVPGPPNAEAGAGTRTRRRMAPPSFREAVTRQRFRLVSCRWHFAAVLVGLRVGAPELSVSDPDSDPAGLPQDVMSP